MTDISRYKNVSLARETYQSRSGTINILVNKEIQRINGKEKSKDKHK